VIYFNTQTRCVNEMESDGNFKYNFYIKGFKTVFEKFTIKKDYSHIKRPNE
jgi:hypothetical protein